MQKNSRNVLKFSFTGLVGSQVEVRVNDQTIKNARGEGVMCVFITW